MLSDTCSNVSDKRASYQELLQIVNSIMTLSPNEKSDVLLTLTKYKSYVTCKPELFTSLTYKPEVTDSKPSFFLHTNSTFYENRN
jgi:hypothetical protein